MQNGFGFNKHQSLACSHMSLVFQKSDPGQESDRLCVAQWLERPLGVREAGVRSPTASHQNVKTGRLALLGLALGLNELGNRLGGSKPV